MDDKITVMSMVRSALEAGGFDGLGCEECSCDLADLMPCADFSIYSEGPSPSCFAGNKLPCDDNCDTGGGCSFHIIPTTKGAQ